MDLLTRAVHSQVIHNRQRTWVKHLQRQMGLREKLAHRTKQMEVQTQLECKIKDVLRCRSWRVESAKISKKTNQFFKQKIQMSWWLPKRTVAMPIKWQVVLRIKERVRDKLKHLLKNKVSRLQLLPQQVSRQLRDHLRLVNEIRICNKLLDLHPKTIYLLSSSQWTRTKEHLYRLKARLVTLKL